MFLIQYNLLAGNEIFWCTICCNNSTGVFWNGISLFYRYANLAKEKIYSSNKMGLPFSIANLSYVK